MSLPWESFQWECLGEERGRAEGEDGLTVSNTYKVNGVRPTSENGILVQSTLFRCKACDQRFAIRGDITELRARSSAVSEKYKSHAKSHDPLAAPPPLPLPQPQPMVQPLALPQPQPLVQPLAQPAGHAAPLVLTIAPLIPSAGSPIANNRPADSSNPDTIHPSDVEAAIQLLDGEQSMEVESTFEQPPGHVPSLDQHQPSQDAEGSSQAPGHSNSSSQPSTTVSTSLPQPQVDVKAIKGDRTLSISFVDRAVLAQSGDRVPLDVLCVDLVSIEMWPRLLMAPPGRLPSIPSMIDETHGLLFGDAPLLLESQCNKMVHLGVQFINGLVAHPSGSSITSIWLINRKDAGPQVKHAILQKLVGTLSTQWPPMPYEQWMSSMKAIGADGLQAVDHKGRLYGWGDWKDPDKLVKMTEPPRGTPLYVSSTFESARLQLEGLQLEEGSEEAQPGEEASANDAMDLDNGAEVDGRSSDDGSPGDANLESDHSFEPPEQTRTDTMLAEFDDNGHREAAPRGDHLRPADSPVATPTAKDDAATQAQTAIVGKKTRSRLDDACTSPATVGNGVEVEPSEIREAGRGLFARGRSFAKGDLVTEYSGARLKDKMEAVQRVVQTHILHCSAAFHGQLGNDIYIDGDRVPQPGRGGASFANHKPKRRCNAEFVYRQIDGEGKVFLQATDDIHDGDEIYAHCGSDLEVMMGEKRREVDGQSTRTVHVPWGALHMHGFEVFKDALRLDEATKVAIKASPSEDIFNGKDGKGRLTSDGRRRQTTGAPEWTTTVTPRLDTFLRTCDVMRCSQGEKTLNKLVALSSRPRASKQKKHQPRHADSAARNSLRDAPSEDVPLACIVALQDGTRLHVWPFDTGVEKIITLEEGDAILFRGDLGHAGSEYDKENWRLHIYIDSPVIERAKEEDGTPSTFPF